MPRGGVGNQPLALLLCGDSECSSSRSIDPWAFGEKAYDHYAPRSDLAQRDKVRDSDLGMGPRKEGKSTTLTVLVCVVHPDVN